MLDIIRRGVYIGINLCNKAVVLPPRTALCMPSNRYALPTSTFSLQVKNDDTELKDCEEESFEPDVLHQRLEVEVRGHDPAVLKSYEWFACKAAKELGIHVSRTWVPPKHVMRRDALKSVHVHKKHIVQYEFRTYFRVVELKYLTGSTADTYLEYIQRNLPEGVAMKVTKDTIERLSHHIKHPSRQAPSIKPSETS